LSSSPEGKNRVNAAAALPSDKEVEHDFEGYRPVNDGFADASNDLALPPRYPVTRINPDGQPIYADNLR